MTDIVSPKERECERCGRRDTWDDDRGVWTIVIDADGTRLSGDPHCLHDWDINGSFNPLNGES